MLRQLAESSEQQTEAIKADAAKNIPPLEDKNPPQLKLSDEPFLVRGWFAILAFFSSSTPENAYALYLARSLGKRLARICPGYINVHKEFYTESMCGELVKLKGAQSFFASLLTSYETGKGEFYIILASLLMKDSFTAITSASDPFSVSYEENSNKDIRSFFLHEMDVAIQAIPENGKSRMYQAAQAIEWIKRFCDLPLERMIMRFVSYEGSDRVCPVDSISEEMKSLVSLLSAAKRIPVLLLEALFLFARQEEMQNGKFDMDQECSRFVSDATNHLSGIGVLKTSIPLADFVRFAIKDVSWIPVVVEVGDDWFQFFRNAWKKRFEEKWVEWNKLHRKAQLRHDIYALLDVKELEPLQYHPWEGMWLPLSLRRELSLTFLKSFFTGLYQKKIMSPLKILLIDGEFYRRENLAEFTDAFSVVDHQQQLIAQFEERLSPKGDIGEGFTLALNEKMLTIRGKARLDNLMLTTDSEVELIIGRVLDAFRSLDQILEGILGVVRGGPYETLVNMASIQGKYNEQYRKDLSMVRGIIRNAAFILHEAEIIEKESL